MDTAVLEQIGLTRNQATIYMTLLKLGSSAAQHIVKESGLHRSRVYDSLEQLQEKGLVSSVVKDFKAYFQAVPPEKLLNYIEEKKEAIQQALPELKKLEGMKKEAIQASIFKGKEGLKTIHAEMLKQPGDIFVLGAKGYIYDELQYFISGFERERLKQGKKWVCLWDDPKMRDKLVHKKGFKGKVLPKGSDSKGVVNIFGSKVAIVLWKEKYPTGFMIENKDIADAFRKWFNLIYKEVQ